MPFYEYECASCKFYMEVMQKITDAPLTKCPSCGEKALRKLVSAPVFRLKGGGWYETDFKSESEARRNLAEGDKPDKAEAEAKAPAAESKPAEGKAAESTAPASSTADAGKAAAKPARAARQGAPARKPAPARRPSKAKTKRSTRKSRR